MDNSNNFKNNMVILILMFLLILMSILTIGVSFHSLHRITKLESHIDIMQNSISESFVKIHNTYKQNKELIDHFDTDYFLKQIEKLNKKYVNINNICLSLKNSITNISQDAKTNNEGYIKSFLIINDILDHNNKTFKQYDKNFNILQNDLCECGALIKYALSRIK